MQSWIFSKIKADSSEITLICWFDVQETSLTPMKWVELLCVCVCVCVFSMKKKQHWFVTENNVKFFNVTFDHFNANSMQVSLYIYNSYEKSILICWIHVGMLHLTFQCSYHKPVKCVYRFHPNQMCDPLPFHSLNSKRNIYLDSHLIVEIHLHDKICCLWREEIALHVTGPSDVFPTCEE